MKTMLVVILTVPIFNIFGNAPAQDPLIKIEESISTKELNELSYKHTGKLKEDTLKASIERATISRNREEASRFKEIHRDTESAGGLENTDYCTFGLY